MVCDSVTVYGAGEVCGCALLCVGTMLLHTELRFSCCSSRLSSEAEGVVVVTANEMGRPSSGTGDAVERHRQATRTLEQNRPDST